MPRTRRLKGLERMRRGRERGAAAWSNSVRSTNETNSVGVVWRVQALPHSSLPGEGQVTSRGLFPS